MRALIACEESQVVTIEFRKLGVEAYSCDIQPCSGGYPEWHLQQNVISILNKKWDLLIAFPPCTYLSNTGNRWFDENRYGEKAKERKRLRLKAFDFFMKFINADIPKICVENSVGWINSHYKKSDQIIQPYYFHSDDNVRKRTCLWLKNLPCLIYDLSLAMKEPKPISYYKTGKRKGKAIHWIDSLGLHSNRARIRSKTFPGIAKAMAAQWSEK